MAKKSNSVKKIAGLALLGAITYLLANRKARSRVKQELQNLSENIREKGGLVGQTSRKAWGSSVDAALRIYQQSRDLTKQQLKELGAIAEDLKNELRSGKKKTGKR
ncbi:hypothetical protein EPN90_00120 [Patescibacteria group bacterium]|nr:MAG: hypothetical protein EPN90_00120 [Patescibacteria group bacterium]